MWTEDVESGEGLVNRFLAPQFNRSSRAQFFGRKHHILWTFVTPNRFRVQINFPRSPD